ncbi:MAG: mobilization protein [Sphingobacterium sp.]|jgi:hypothetical protein|nr:mobilization protein [Sphingobacterium sp.]
MSRKQIKNQEEVLTHPIIVRLSQALFEKLVKLQHDSGAKSVGQVVRDILENRKINFIVKDRTMNPVMEELAMIRKEIKSIGVNINQQTHKFHIAQSATERQYHENKTAKIYAQLEPQIERLLAIVSKLADKWLQG